MNGLKCACGNYVFSVSFNSTCLITITDTRLPRDINDLLAMSVPVNKISVPFIVSCAACGRMPYKETASQVEALPNNVIEVNFRLKKRV